MFIGIFFPKHFFKVLYISKSAQILNAQRDGFISYTTTYPAPDPERNHQLLGASPPSPYPSLQGRLPPYYGYGAGKIATSSATPQTIY